MRTHDHTSRPINGIAGTTQSLEVADPSRAELAIVFKRLKLVSLASTASVTWALVFFVVGLWARRGDELWSIGERDVLRFDGKTWKPLTLGGRTAK